MKKIILMLIALLILTTTINSAGLEIGNINYVPSPAKAGEIIDLYLTIDNNSNIDKKNIEVELNLESPFLEVSGQETKKTITTITKRQSGLVKFTIKIDPNARQGTEMLKVNIRSEEDSPGTYFGKKVPIYISANNPKVKITQTNQTTIKPGEEIEIELELTNVGSSTANNTIVEIDDLRTVTSTGQVIENDILPIGATTQFIGKIEQGETKIITITFVAKTNSEQKTQVIPITTKYYNNTETELVETSYIGIRIIDEPTIEITESTTKNIGKGQIAELSFNLFNISSTTARYLVIELESEDIQIETKKIFVGNMEGDDFDTIKFNAYIPTTLEKNEAEITAKIIYQNSKSEQEQIEKKLVYSTIPLANTQADSDSTGTILIIIILLLVGVIFWQRRKHKKTK